MILPRPIRDTQRTVGSVQYPGKICNLVMARRAPQSRAFLFPLPRRGFTRARLRHAADKRRRLYLSRFSFFRVLDTRRLQRTMDAVLIDNASKRA